MIKILFVCTGNICRSPAAHGVFEKMVKDHQLEKKFEIDSAGLISFHKGEAPDIRSQKHAKNRGYDLSSQRSRPVTPKDFEYYDLIIAMDEGHEKELKKRSPEKFKHKIKLMLSYSGKWKNESVPDPYYSEAEAFELVMDQVEEACGRLFDSLKY